MKNLILALMAAGLLAGCTSFAVEPGTRYTLMEPQQWNGGTAQFLIGGCRHAERGESGALPCVELVTAPADGEAWLFETRQRVVSGLGIPFGREPVDRLVVGPQAKCEWTRATLRVKPHLFYSAEKPPTEACKGPFFFRRVESPAQ
jgi:hypothetical protein